MALVALVSGTGSVATAPASVVPCKGQAPALACCGRSRCTLCHCEGSGAADEYGTARARSHGERERSLRHQHGTVHAAPYGTRDRSALPAVPKACMSHLTSDNREQRPPRAPTPRCQSWVRCSPALRAPAASGHNLRHQGASQGPSTDAMLTRPLGVQGRHTRRPPSLVLSHGRVAGRTRQRTSRSYATPMAARRSFLPSDSRRRRHG